MSKKDRLQQALLIGFLFLLNLFANAFPSLLDDLQKQIPFLTEKVQPPNDSPNEHVYILEVDSAVADYENPHDWAEVTRLFYKTFPEKINTYDFLGFFPTFSIKMEEEARFGFAWFAKNQVRGICQPISYVPYYWGSDYVEGIQIYMYNTETFEMWSTYPNLAMAIVLQEISHRFLTHVGKLKPPIDEYLNNLNQSCLAATLPLLLEDNDHWSFGLQMLTDNFGAMREALPWREMKDGTYRFDSTLYHKPRKFHPFDLYLMGLIDPKEIKDSFLLLTDIENKDVENYRYNDRFIETKAKAQKVTIKDIIAIAGEERNPSFKESQKDFMTAFVILKKKDQKIPEIVIKTANIMTNMLPEAWAYATDYKSTMNKNATSAATIE